MRFMDTRPIKWDPQTLDSLSESDDSFEILPIPKRNQIKPKVPKPAKNPHPAPKPTSRQLTLLLKKKDEENLKNSNKTEDTETEKKSENEEEKDKDTETEKKSENKEEKENASNKQSTSSSKNFATKHPASKFGRSHLKSLNSSNVITTNKGNISVSKPRRRKVAHKFPCPWCSETLKQLQLFQAHVKDNHQDVKYTCRFCNRTFQTYGGKRKHEVLHLPPRHFCQFCQKGFHFNNKLIEHRRYHTKENLEECQVCHKTFVSKRYLKEHSKKHVDEGKHFKCTSCTRTCSSQANLCAHVRGAHEGRYTTLCGKKINWPPKYH